MMLTTDQTTTFEHEVGARGTVQLETVDTEIRLRGVPGTTVRLRLVAGDLDREFRIQATDGRLDLRPVRRWAFGPRRDVGPLEVEVPTGARVRAQTASGTILALDLSAGLEAKTAAGGIDLAGLAGDVSAKTVSGSIRLRAEAVDDLALKTVSGGIDARAASVRSTAARSISGSIRVAGRFADDGAHGIETVSGGVTVAADGPIQLRASTVSGVVRTDQESLAGGAGRRTLTLGGRGPVLDVRTVSGSIQVRRWEPEMPVGPADRDDAGTADPAVPAPAAGPVDDDPRLPILRALQRGDIDVAEAERQLTALESPATDPSPASIVFEASDG